MNYYNKKKNIDYKTRIKIKIIENKTKIKLINIQKIIIKKTKI